MTARAGLAGVAPQSPRRALDELVARGQRAAAAGKERPVAVLELVSGRTVSGRAVALADDSGLAMLLLHTGGTERAPQVLQLRVDQVVAVGYELTAPAPAASGEPPGRLELSRALCPLGEELASVLGATLEVALGDVGSDEARRAVAACLPVVRQALGHLARDAMGKDALRALSRVCVGAAARRAVRRSGGELIIEAAEGELAEPWTRAELVAELERVL